MEWGCCLSQEGQLGEFEFLREPEGKGNKSIGREALISNRSALGGRRRLDKPEDLWRSSDEAAEISSE